MDGYQWWRRWARLPRQVMGRSPFQGSARPTRVPLLSISSTRPTLPFPHPWNYQRPIRILETFFHEADAESGFGRHNRYLEVPGFAPVLVTRDPRVIRAIATETGDRPGQFDRDTMPSAGIARATGEDSLLYANGAVWKRQKKLSTPPFARSNLFQPEQFHEFSETFRHTVRRRLEAMRQRLAKESRDHPGATLRITLEPEIKSVMLEMLVNNFFGAEVAYEEIRNRYVPALQTVIDHIVRDTVLNKLGIPLRRMPSFRQSIADAKAAQCDFEHLTDIVLDCRKSDTGLWKQFKSDAPDAALRSNIRVFLAGALEATTSYASWAISHLARNSMAQDKTFAEVKHIDHYTPQTLESAKYLGHVLDETLRLTPSLYFLPRRATADTTLDVASGETLMIPAGTHVLLDVWHANRHEDHWGVPVTGHPAAAFVPERWEAPDLSGKAADRRLHFGFGHGPRFCPGKSLGQLEVALVVGAFVKLFRFAAPNPSNEPRAGVSTKPADEVLIEMSLREPETTREVADPVVETRGS